MAKTAIFDNAARFAALGGAIAHYRKRKGLSQDRLAELVGISRQHMGAVEAPHMNRGISLDLLFNIAAVLEIEPYLLLKFRPEER
ncbi:MAG: helix-turn-helix transcriptional regulator [Oscillospiraceae bacterium]|nr:helix-turn-helix transcriptional regulator [Oscillospiraceae bacterium]